ncbi:MAG TPA: hypothetical protein VGL97_02175 [Bryobacteraceae bacterium]
MPAFPEQLSLPSLTAHFRHEALYMSVLRNAAFYRFALAWTPDYEFLRHGSSLSSGLARMAAGFTIHPVYTE